VNQLGWIIDKTFSIATTISPIITRILPGIAQVSSSVESQVFSPQIVKYVLATGKILSTMLFMASKSDITAVTPASMRDMAKSLRQIAGHYEQMAKLLDDEDIDELQDVRSLVTGVQGVLDVGTFCGYVLTSFLHKVGEKGMREIAGAQAEFQIRQKHTKAHRDAVKAAIEAKKLERPTLEQDKNEADKDRKNVPSKSRK
jgi:hypothetical protein